MTGHSFTSSGAEVFTLRSSEVGLNWGWISTLLERVKSPPWTVEHVLADLKATRAQLWGLMTDGQPVAIVITRIENFHDTRFGLIWIAAGEGVEHSRKLLDEIEGWFRGMGCSRVEISGRRGWERVLPDYEFKAVVLAKEL